MDVQEEMEMIWQLHGIYTQCLILVSTGLHSWYLVVFPGFVNPQKYKSSGRNVSHKIQCRMLGRV